MDYTNDGPGAPARREAGFEVGGIDQERIREMADDYARTAEEYANRARELVTRYPVHAVAGAALAGFLFARVVRSRYRS